MVLRICERLFRQLPGTGTLVETPEHGTRRQQYYGRNILAWALVFLIYSYYIVGVLHLGFPAHVCHSGQDLMLLQGCGRGALALFSIRLKHARPNATLEAELHAHANRLGGRW